MEISIGIPTCNRPWLFVEALLSCVNQSYLPTEIVVGDDSLNNDTELLLNELILKNGIAIKINYFKNYPSLGQGRNVNKIIENIKYSKFLLLHDDDKLEINALKLLLSEFENSVEPHVVYGKQLVIEENGKINHHKTTQLNEHTKRSEQSSIFSLSSINAAIVQQFPNDAFLINTACFKSVKYFDESRNAVVGTAVDFDFAIRLALTGYSFKYINVYTSKYRITRISVSKSKKDNAALMAFQILSNLPKCRGDFKYKEQRLKHLAPAAFMQAINGNHTNEVKLIFFSKWYNKRIFSPGGIKRLLYFLLSLLSSRISLFIFIN